MAGEQSVAELILKIVADSSEVRKELQEVNDAQKKFAGDTKESSKDASNAIDEALNKTKEHGEKTRTSMEKFGGSLRQISRGMTMMGTMMMAPVVAALASASKVNYSVASSMRSLGIATQSFSNEIAKAALPMVEKLTKFVFDLSDSFSKLPDKTKQGLVEFVAKGGAFLIAIGTVTRLLSLLAQLKNFGPIIVAVTITVGAISAIEWLKNHKKEYEEWILKMKTKFQDFWDFVKTGNTQKPPAMVFGWGGEGPGTKKGDAEIAAAAKAVTLDKIIVKTHQATEAASRFAGKWKETLQGLEGGLIKAAQQFGNWGTMMENFALNFATAMANAFSDFFFDLFSGEMKSMEEYAASFGKAILRMIANLIAQLLALWAVVQLLNLTPTGRAVIAALGWGGLVMGGSKHEGGEIGLGGFMRKAHEGLAAGEYPIIAQEGEGYLSRNGMATIGGAEGLAKVNAGGAVGGGLNVNLVQVIRAWGPEDVYRESKTLAGAMISELEKNGAFRTAMRKYR